MEGFVEIEGFPNYFIAHSPPRVIRLVNGEHLECKQTPNSVKDNYWVVALRDVNGVFKKRRAAFGRLSFYSLCRR